MFRKSVSELINKVSNIAGMIRARAPAPRQHAVMFGFDSCSFCVSVRAPRKSFKKYFFNFYFLIFVCKFLFVIFFIVKNYETIKT